MPHPNSKGISVYVDRELHAEITAYLQENNMKMTGRTAEQIKAAEVLYILALSGQTKKPGFVAKLAGWSVCTRHWTSSKSPSLLAFAPRSRANSLIAIVIFNSLSAETG